MTALALALALAPTQLLGPAVQPGTLIDRARTAVVVTDLDGDGRRDVLWSAYTGGDVGWAAGLGGGAFTGAQRLSADSFEPFVQTAVDTIDVDGDGDLDVVYGAETVFGLGARWLENLGGGAFAPAAPLPGGPTVVRSLAVTDADGDGDDDLVLGSGASSYAIEWMEWTPGAGLAPAVVRQSVPGVPVEPKGGDLDGDGIPDLVWLELFGYEVRWSRGLPGGASAAPQTLYSAGTLDYDLFDMDGDGDLDLVVQAGSPATVAILLNDGAGAFSQVAVSLSTGAAVAELRGADLDGDGDGDLVVLAGNQIGPRSFQVHVNGGGFVFSAQTVPVESLDSNSGEVGADDLDGDGDLDPWFAGRDVLWRPNGGAGTFGAPRPLADSPLPPVFSSGRCGDVDGDGRPELVTTWAGGLVVAKNYLTGPAIVTALPAGTGTVPNQTPVLVDIDGDGDEDVLLAMGRLFGGGDGEVVLFENAGGVQAPVSVTGPIGRGLRTLAGDGDGDGRTDVYVEWVVDGASDWSRAWWFQAPAGGFVRGALGAEGNLFALDTGDIDGDGREDVLAGKDNGAQTVLVWASTEAGGALAPSVVIGTLSSTFNSFDLAPLADVDGDGVLDVCASDPGRGLVVARGLGGGAFGPLALVASGPAPLQKEIAAGDVDLDGHMDVVARTGSTLLVFAGDGQGGFAPPVDQALSSGFPGTLGSLNLTDLDGDHDLDVVRVAGSLQVHLGSPRLGAGYCQAESAGSNGSRPRIFAEGSLVASRNDLTLGVDRLPPGAFGLFAVSANRDRLPGLGGVGTLCLGTGVSRFQRPGEIRQADAAGVVSLTLDLTDVPAPGGSEVITPGATRYFQYWTRDVIGGAATSNFSGALVLRFR